MPSFRTLLGDGSQWGISHRLRRAAEPGRPGAGLRHRRAFVGGEPSCLVLGDNLIYGHGLTEVAAVAPRASEDGRQRVRLPRRGSRALRRRRLRRHGPGDLDRGEARAAEIALGGDRPLFLRRARSSRSRKALKPSARGEHEITDLNNVYLAARQAAGRAARPRLRLVRHGHARRVARGRRVRARAADAAGPAHRLARGDRLPAALDEPGRT